ncbi:ankyrin repeat and SOCS box protein 2-like [Gymnodraco acuticeps]|uniref:Ankyrin repeat and SOCS box protein 2-like n=1 Tax=Gymnodraco acuticeps TaxID=8218 RepID=A0A6P8TMM0_GYMAC|nr:ankyrin repeat and SOCS box protein 2-like [Gymnodraco acuticeps]
MELDDYSMYNQLSDEELLQIAVERSLSDLSTASSLPPATPPPPSPPHASSGVNTPRAMSNFPYRAFRREFSPLQTLIMNGEADALIDLVRRRSSSLMEQSDEGWIALHEAAFYGQLQCVSVLVTAFPDSVNRCSLKSESALLLAAGQGNVSCVDFLLKHGADPNIANKDRETTLFIACEKPNEAIVDLLLRGGAEVNRSNAQGASALHEVCMNGQLKLCRMLLESGAHLQSKNVYGIRPLFIAAQHGHADIIQLLAKKGADVDGQAADGASPLFEACKNGHVSAVEVLLSLKADANRSMKSGLLPLHVAVQNNHSRIVSLLIQVTSMVRVQRSGISPLHIAAEKNQDEIMDLLIKSGFEVNSELSEAFSIMYKDRRSTALCFSVHNMNLEAAEMLLEAGADPNLDLFNPLLIAVRLGRIDMVALLLRYGANANVQIPTQPSSFPAAILLRMESLPMLKLLLDNGCDAGCCFDCPYGQKPHLAVQPSGFPNEEMQFCEAISCLTFCHVAGPIISLLLDYVGHVRLCSRLIEVLEIHSDWAPIKLKAVSPHPLMQLCRLEIRRLLAVQRLKLLHTLPLPVRLVRFLHYDVTCDGYM